MARLHWIAAVIVLSICVGTSVQMVSATRAHELWGHLPMIQFLSAWLVIVLVLYRKRAPWNDRYWLYSSLSGFLLALGFLPLHVPGSLFLGFVPLLHILADRKKGGKNFFFYAFNAMIIWNIIATFWVANTAYAAGIFANVVNSLLMTLPLLAYGFISSKLSRGIGLLSFVACWITFEFLHMRWELYWPWLTLGNGLSFMHWGVQWYEYTGVLGG
ncbi:MAG: hypothetical protein KTR24_01500, partial [Saprospiraceae bacterium]|nr:hypothetical protein [Saprospiraceae bacterium]